MNKKAKGLGKGLGALLPDAPIYKEEAGEKIILVALNKITANEEQPRKNFDEEKLSELAQSIKEHGLVQPVLLFEQAPGQYRIIAGERRFRAARLAGLKQIPSIIRDLAENEAEEIALIENIQREDLNAFEEASALARLQEKGGYTQEVLAEKIGKSRPYVANALRLLTLDKEILSMLAAGKISGGHGKALLMVKSPVNRQALAKKIFLEGLSVRAAEELAKAYNNEVEKPVKKLRLAHQNPVLANVEKRLQHKLGTKVKIESKGKGGILKVDFYSQDDLQRLLDMLLPNEEF